MTTTRALLAELDRLIAATARAYEDMTAAGAVASRARRGVLLASGATAGERVEALAAATVAHDGAVAAWREALAALERHEQALFVARGDARDAGHEYDFSMLDAAWDQCRDAVAEARCLVGGVPASAVAAAIAAAARGARMGG